MLKPPLYSHKNENYKDSLLIVSFTVCISGYELDGGACALCPKGSYKSGIGDGSCIECTGNRSTLDTGMTASADCCKYQTNNNTTRQALSHFDVFFCYSIVWLCLRVQL